MAKHVFVFRLEPYKSPVTLPAEEGWWRQNYGFPTYDANQPIEEYVGILAVAECRTPVGEETSVLETFADRAYGVRIRWLRIEERGREYR